MHLLIRVVRRCVPYHRDFVAELGGIANGSFDTGVRYQANHDELVYAVPLELKIQICVRKTA